MQSFVIRTVKNCFKECVNDFETSQMNQEEKTCVDRCILRSSNTNNEIESILPEVDAKYQD